MWFFMITCYVLSLLTFVMLLTGLTQSFLHFPVWNAGHLTFMILVSIVYLFTETLVIFFYVGTGVSIKEYTLEHHLDKSFHNRSISATTGRLIPYDIGTKMIPISRIAHPAN